MSSIAPEFDLPPAHGRVAVRPWDGLMRLGVATFILVLALNIAHEAGHALAAKALGYDILASINHVKLTSGIARSNGDRLLIDLAGPAVTLAIALIAWLAGMRGASRLAPSIVFIALAMRVIAAAVSLGMPNDEARASLMLGMGKWTIFALVIGLLVTLFVSLYRRRALGGRWLLVSYVGTSLGFMTVVFGEPLMPAFKL